MLDYHSKTLDEHGVVLIWWFRFHDGLPPANWVVVTQDGVVYLWARITTDAGLLWVQNGVALTEPIVDAIAAAADAAGLTLPALQASMDEPLSGTPPPVLA